MAPKRNRQWGATWGAPLWLAFVTTVGLVSALFSDGGAGDILAGVLLSLPVATGLWFGYIRRANAPD